MATTEERLAAVETDIRLLRSECTDCRGGVVRWQNQQTADFNAFKADLKKDLNDIYTELRRRLPLWATAGGGLLLAVIGWFIGSR